MTLQDIFLRGITYFYRLNAFLAGTGILSGVLLRIFTGQHKASFAILAFGLSCFYIAIASKYLVHNWFLKGEPNPEYETKRRKWLVVYLLMGLPFWLPFCAIVTVSLFDKVYVNEYTINQTPLFQTETLRFIEHADSLNRQSLGSSGEEKYVFKRNNQRLRAILYVALHTNKKIEKPTSESPNKHTVIINNKKYGMTVQSHQSRFGWVDFREGQYNNHELCQLFIPVLLVDSKDKTIDPNSLDSHKIEFLENPELNAYNLTIDGNELRIDNVLEKPDRADSLCRGAAHDFIKTKVRSTIGLTALSSAPVELQKHIIFPGIMQSVLSENPYDRYLIVQTPYDYLENVRYSFNSIFNRR
ncbi:hypothetical protein A9Q99_04930 [Gammaproteobacteria bacterium 45_16_T64]|nr:hypothetical protein A9Q99_04930 [Gammaproteobacteria bacterium 45_16_T64]